MFTPRPVICRIRSPPRLRAMSTKAYIVPLDPQNPVSGVVPSVDTAALWAKLPRSQKLTKVGSSYLFYGTPGKDVAALASLGEGFANKTGNECRERIRKAVGSGVKTVKALGEGVSEAVVDISQDPHAVGEISLPLRIKSCSDHIV